MSEYMPKVGDRVRATLGENVLVGGFEYADRLAAEIRVNGSLFSLFLPDGWQFEQVVEVPTKFGAVIRRADGTVFLLAEPRSADGTDWFGAGCGWHRPHEATEGGFTVLFEGADE